MLCLKHKTLEKRTEAEFMILHRYDFSFSRMNVGRSV